MISGTSSIRRALPVAVAALSLVLLASAPPAQDGDDIYTRIREEGRNNSQIMRTMHYLTDVYGPRLTASPNLEKAGEWAVQQMTAWGLQNGHLEPFDFGHPGWLNEKFAGHILAPVHDNLVGEVLAWTPSTNGTVRSTVVHLVPPDDPTEAILRGYLDGFRDRAWGRIVLVGEHREIPVAFEAPSKRRDDERTRCQFDPDCEPPGGGRGGRGPRPQQERDPEALNAREVDAIVNEFLVEAGAAVKVQDAARPHGQIRAFSNRTYDPEQAPPTVILRNEDYGRIVRLVGDGTDVELEFTIVNRIYPAGSTVHNAIAEIRGTDLADEVIMLGGHLDSWHSATGATDNAIGCAVMMEAARILEAVGVRPRRTVRVALWGGEEQGLLGSQAYVARHFGSVEDPTPEFEKFGGYFNIDSGTGRARGMTVFGPPEAAEVLRTALRRFEGLGFAGVVTTDSRRRGGSDHTSFNEAGLPGIGVSQDPIEYGSHTWHTNLDTYERIVEEDVQNSAIIIASAVYTLAMQDEMLPRFSADEMPPRPGGQGR